MQWRNILTLKNSLIQSSSSILQSSSFHSTPVYFQKSKDKWSSAFRSGQQPSKNYIKYSTRQKRADTKRALNDLLHNCGSYNIPDDDPIWNLDGKVCWDSEEADISGKKGRSKGSARRAVKNHYMNMRRRLRRMRKKNFTDDFDGHPETYFQATYGNRSYTWSFNQRDDYSFRFSSNGFEWRENSNYPNKKKKEWETTGETESDDESVAVGSYSERTVLGLPSRGPLKIEDVKNAFRISALKWHPDKHQGPSKDKAEEKFKVCVGAYKSLCSELSTV